MEREEGEARSEREDEESRPGRAHPPDRESRRAEGHTPEEERTEDPGTWNDRYYAEESLMERLNEALRRMRPTDDRESR